MPYFDLPFVSNSKNPKTKSNQKKKKKKQIKKKNKKQQQTR